jgi:hypothetical protein
MTFRVRNKWRGYREQIKRANSSPYAKWLRMMLRIGSSLRKRNFGLTNECDVCGKPATQWLGDPWGKSDVKRPKCAEHGLRLRDPLDIAEIERLRAILADIVRDGGNDPSSHAYLGEAMLKRIARTSEVSAPTCCPGYVENGRQWHVPNCPNGRAAEPGASPLCDGEVRVVYVHGEPSGVRDASGYLCQFNRIPKWEGQEDRYRSELTLRARQAEAIATALRSAEKPATPPDDDSAHVRPEGSVVATAIYTPVKSTTHVVPQQNGFKDGSTVHPDHWPAGVGATQMHCEIHNVMYSSLLFCPFCGPSQKSGGGQ